MCRSIRTLFNFEPPVTQDEIRAASLQFVRKVTGFNKPSKVNEAAFLKAVEEITGISENFCVPCRQARRRRIEKKKQPRRTNGPLIDFRCDGAGHWPS